MKKKVMSLILTSALAVSLTACGGGGQESTSTTAAPAETTKAAAENNSDEAKEPAGGEGGSLVYWSMWEATEPQGQAIQAAVDQFTKDTGITVDLQFKGRTGIREGLQPALDAGTNIDMFDEDIDRVNTTWGQYLMDLEDLAKSANYEATANAGLIAACRDVGGGTLKSIPYQPNGFAIFSNQALFDEGLAHPDQLIH